MTYPSNRHGAGWWPAIATLAVVLALILWARSWPWHHPPAPRSVSTPPVNSASNQERLDSAQSHRRRLDVVISTEPGAPDVAALDRHHQAMRDDAALSRRQRLDLLMEQLDRFQPGSDAFVATLYSLASEVPVERLDALIDRYRLIGDGDSQSLLLQVMRIAVQEPMLGALAMDYAQGADALYLLAGQNARIFQEFLVSEGLSDADPRLFADVVWTRAALVPRDQGMEIIGDAMASVQGPLPDLLLARLYSDLLFEDPTLTPLLLDRALRLAESVRPEVAIALAREWRDRVNAGALDSQPGVRQRLSRWLEYANP